MLARWPIIITEHADGHGGATVPLSHPMIPPAAEAKQPTFKKLSGEGVGGGDDDCNFFLLSFGSQFEVFGQNHS
jgi:hypothetical protein